MKVSIIMPMYNSELYIGKTIKSILQQTYSNFELIIIDDCSTDECYKIASEYANKDHRIRLVRNTKNLGISGNRNKGLSLATGECIVFCDDDDILDKSLLNDNMAIMNDSSIDMIKFGREIISVNSQGQEFDRKKTVFDVSGLIENKYDEYFKIRRSDALYNVWNGVYRKTLLDKFEIKFDESMKYGGEDADFSYRCYYYANKIFINPKTYYKHYKRELTSTSRKYNINKVESVLRGLQQELRIWQRINFDNVYNRANRIIALNINIDNIMFSQFFHKESDLKYTQRKSIYNSFYVDTLRDNYILDRETKKILKKISIKHYFISKIINTNNYKLIDSFYKLASKIKNRKWK